MEVRYEILILFIIYFYLTRVSIIVSALCKSETSDRNEEVRQEYFPFGHFSSAFIFFPIYPETCTTSPFKIFLFLEMNIADRVGDMQIPKSLCSTLHLLFDHHVCHFHGQILVISKAMTRTNWQYLHQAYSVEQIERFLAISASSLSKISHIFFFC